ncbi:serine/threonine-protein kinase [Pseudoxanthomonas sp. PXM02]|uniref:serine/threonine-protein kinase n=1 Tax=Pseudoxanthomonas sp. PXM02 TaxID=2769294 RepID=UPI0017819BAE|nr:serine/threonine-protein kinase [Pseudoxanthomonas sp. PXM02]MBD9480713.1 serine/threonine protein kinase [Pseudoxanthomonas sp. PXM02]
MSDLQARALELFDEYVELARPQRAAALARLKARDAPLHDALARLLAADTSPSQLEGIAFDALLDAQAGDDDDASSVRIGNRLGPWRIDRVLESGGMGTVYEASRADGQYEKQVALKCMRAGMSSPALIDAFMRERNHLAQLDHPHIAPLLDGGIEADGRPWFAMRLVRGTSMDLWADQQRLSLADRVRLLLQVCQALRYAHGRGVLHQDIKPGNLPVSADGRVHLVDFGLSAMIDGLEASMSPQIAVSNGYTAPEVLAGGTASTTSDLYSVGVMLYRLLVDDWPRPLPPLHASLIGLPATAPVQPPSELAVTASADIAWKRRYRNPRQLQRHLRGDLDAIALTAVASSPADRYATIDALIEDLERWLARRPVLARGGGHAYATQRFLQRHALASALAGAVMVVGAGGASVLGWLHLQDRQELLDAQAVSAVFERTLGSVTLSGLTETRPSSTRMLERTERELRALPVRSDPAIKARAFASLARSYAALGEYPHALALASEANGLLADDKADPSDTQAMLATLLNLEARHADARDIATQGLQRASSTRPAGDPATLALLVELARAHWGLSEYDDAFNALAFAQETASAASTPAALDARIELLVLRAQWHLQLLELQEADSDLQRAATLARDSTPSVVDNVDETRLALRLLQRRHAEAGQLADTLLASRRQRLGPDHPETARSRRLQLDVAEQAGDASTLTPDALQSAHKAIVAAYGTRHPEYARQLLLEARATAGGDARKQLDLARQATQLLEATLGPRHPTTLLAKEEQARALLAVAALPSDSTRDPLLDEAKGLLQEVIHANGQRHWPSPTARYWLARALTQRHDPAAPLPVAERQQAETLLQDALVEASRHYGTTHATTTMIRDALVHDFQPSATPPASSSIEAGPSMQ